MTRSELRDFLDFANMKAFLAAIRFGEGTADPAGYYRLVGGGNFIDDSHHPNQRIYIARYKVYSTAAGAYQIIYPTWTWLEAKYGFHNFKPATQDEACVALIHRRGAIANVLGGHFEDAVEQCSQEWASLPGSTAGQRIESLDKLKRVYIDHGGTIA